MDTEYCFSVVNEPELDQLLAGHEVVRGRVWPRSTARPVIDPGLTGVFWKRAEGGVEPVRPLALVSREEDLRRLCGRYAQIRTDLSPITAWCHLLTPEFLNWLDSPVREAQLRGLEAAWTGLIVAEALLLAEKPLANIKISACLATQGFAIARTKALWEHLPLEVIVSRFDSANRLYRNESARTARLRSALRPIWSSLIELLGGIVPAGVEVQPIVTALQSLQHARLNKDKQEARQLAIPLLAWVPEAHEFRNLTELTPELRLRLFDKLVNRLQSMDSDLDSVRRNGLALLAGYLATVAAGGAPSLSLAESNAHRLPEVVAWAYLIGGVGEKVIWTSGFDGLGRLVARELVRPSRFDEPPTCDFALDEAAVLLDQKLTDPLVHLRIKQARILTVALFPGVNIPVAIAESSIQENGKAESAKSVRQADTSVTSPTAVSNPLAVFADAIWPYLQDYLDDYLDDYMIDSRWRSSEQGRTKRKSTSQSSLPLKDSKK